MIERKILDELRKLTNNERLAIIEATLDMIRKDLKEVEKTSKDERKQKLAEAANMLLADYMSDEDLTAFKSLDCEDFHV
jgi:CHASE3 domain sensor protein